MSSTSKMNRQNRAARPSNETISVTNDGGEITHTNFWMTRLARGGGLFISSNARTLRLLVPQQHVPAVREGLSTASECVVSRGVLMGVPALEMLFEDGSENPFSVHVGPGQFDRLPAKGDHGREDLTLIVYGPGIRRLGTLPAKFRVVDELPCLMAWSDSGSSCHRT